MPFTFGTNTINEGDVSQLTCLVSRGDEPLRITWSLKGDIISSEPSMTTTMLGTRVSMLMITSVGYRHSGTYTCTATNAAGTASYSTELKVNGTLFSKVEREKLRVTGKLFYYPLLAFMMLSIFQNHPRLFHSHSGGPTPLMKEMLLS